MLQLNSDSFCDYTNLKCIDRTLVSRDRFLIFPQEMVKIYAPADFGQDADILAVTTASTVRERRRPYKLGGLSAQIT